ncbi:MAG: hypothetical protein IH588_02555 [Anaerolineales bacterium]|nr:hypothetical protein [Anaerolineales bacterium]
MAKTPCSVCVTFAWYDYTPMSNKMHYSAFLIRWQGDGPQTRWRATVEHAYTGQKYHFLDKSELLHFLWQSLYEGEMSDSTGANDQEKA